VLHEGDPLGDGEVASLDAVDRVLVEQTRRAPYHEKSAIRILNSAPTLKLRQSRQRVSPYDEAVGAALIVLWEASDRVCGKRLKALLPFCCLLSHAMDISSSMSSSVWRSCR
jgi:hypothetical protein